MCYCQGGYPPDPGAYVIADLEVGDEIILKKGHGEPIAEEDQTLVIMEVADYSALCSNGTILKCTDGQFVTKTGRKAKVKPNLKARRVQLAIAQLKIGRWFEESRSSIDTKIWMLSYKLRERFGIKKG